MYVTSYSQMSKFISSPFWKNQVEVPEEVLFFHRRQVQIYGRLYFSQYKLFSNNGAKFRSEKQNSLLSGTLKQNTTPNVVVTYLQSFLKIDESRLISHKIQQCVNNKILCQSYLKKRQIQIKKVALILQIAKETSFAYVVFCESSFFQALAFLLIFGAQ